MIAIPPMVIADTLVLVSTTAADEAAWVVGTTYAAGAVVSKNQRKYTSLQAANVGKDPETEPLWWFDDGPSNKWAMFDTSVQTGTSVTGASAVDLTFTIKAGRSTAVGLMGLVGQSVTLTVRDGLGGAVISTDTKTLIATDGSYYSFCFEDFYQQSDAAWTGLYSSANGHITITITGTLMVSCGLCVIGKQFNVGRASYGFSMPIEDRGRSYLDSLGNPVQIDRGYSKGCSGTVTNTRENFNRLMAFYSANISNPCLWIAAPGLTDLVSATVFGKLSRVVPVLSSFSEVTASIEVSGYR